MSFAVVNVHSMLDEVDTATGFDRCIRALLRAPGTMAGRPCIEDEVAELPTSPATDLRLPLDCPVQHLADQLAYLGAEL